MLYTQKTNSDFNNYAEKVIHYAEKSGFEEIRADFTGYESPASLTMVNNEVTLTPDITAKRGKKKFYFELVVKNEDETTQRMLISKWKALEAIAKIKGGFLQLFVPSGSFKFASMLVKNNGIEARLTKLSDLK